MPQVGAHALATVVHIPDFDFGAHAGRHQEVAIVWEEADGRQALGVAGPCVDPFLGNVATVVLRFLVLRPLDPGITLEVCLRLNACHTHVQ